MSIHSVQLPNGSLLSINGGSAQTVANIITARLNPGARNEGTEENDMPPIFQPRAESNTEEVLEVPAMNFAKSDREQSKKKLPSAPLHNDASEAASMLMPPLTFEKFSG